MAMERAPTVPMSPRNGMPVTLSASRAMRTVAPAKTTALPDVPLARPIDSLDVIALLQLAPVPVDDEERVVDAHREAEHQAEDRGHGGHLDDAGEGHRDSAPMPTPMSAVRIGRPAPMSVPSMTTRTTAATTGR